MMQFLRWSLPALLLLSLIGCAGSPVAAPSPTEAPTAEPLPTEIPATPTETGPFVLTSTSFAEGEEIPTRYTYSRNTQCQGENYSPELNWSGVPAGTESFAITMIDQGISHWLQFNIP